LKWLLGELTQQTIDQSHTVDRNHTLGVVLCVFA